MNHNFFRFHYLGINIAKKMLYTHHLREQKGLSGIDKSSRFYL